MGSKVSQNRRLLAYALQLNRPAEFACGDAGEPWGTYSGTKLETAVHMGKPRQKPAPALVAATDIEDEGQRRILLHRLNDGPKGEGVPCACCAEQQGVGNVSRMEVQVVVRP